MIQYIKVTIIPRGRALGVTFFLPEGDQISISQKQLESKLSTLYAGRLAEDLIYGERKIIFELVHLTILKWQPILHVIW